MKALVFHKPKDVRIDYVEDPNIREARDVIVRVTAAAISGSDLHVYNGAVAQSRPLILGQEFMGRVEEVGTGVTNLVRGDRVVVPAPIACGDCWFCARRWPTQCERSNPKFYGPEGGQLRGKGGALFGYTDLYGGYPGGQAEYVRVPYGDYGPRRVPDELADEQILFVGDILPTGWAAIDWAELGGGETVAVFGCGPVGLMAQKAAWLHGAHRVIAIDVLPYRLDVAARVARAETVDASVEDVVEAIRDKTDGRGADVCIDAVGLEVDRGFNRKAGGTARSSRGSAAAVEMAFSAVRRGGRISIVGTYATDCDDFPLAQMLDKAITVRAGQAPVHNYIDQLIDLIRQDEIRTDDIITHVLPLSDAPRGYELFNRKQDECVKVVLKP